MWPRLALEKRRNQAATFSSLASKVTLSKVGIDHRICSRSWASNSVAPMRLATARLVSRLTNICWRVGGGVGCARPRSTARDNLSSSCDIMAFNLWSPPALGQEIAELCNSNGCTHFRDVARHTKKDRQVALPVQCGSQEEPGMGSPCQGRRRRQRLPKLVLTKA